MLAVKHPQHMWYRALHAERQAAHPCGPQPLQLRRTDGLRVRLNGYLGPVRQAEGVGDLPQDPADAFRCEQRGGAAAKEHGAGGRTRHGQHLRRELDLLRNHVGVGGLTRATTEFRGGIGIEVVSHEGYSDINWMFPPLVNMAGGIVRNNTALNGGAIGFYNFSFPEFNVYPFPELYSWWAIEGDQINQALHRIAIAQGITFADNFAWAGWRASYWLSRRHSGSIQPTNLTSWPSFNNSDIHSPSMLIWLYVEDHFMPDYMWSGEGVTASTSVEFNRITSRPGYSFYGWEFKITYCCCTDSSLDGYVDVEFLHEEPWSNNFTRSFFSLSEQPFFFNNPWDFGRYISLHARAVWKSDATGNTPCNNTNLAHPHPGIAMSSSSNHTFNTVPRNILYDDAGLLWRPSTWGQEYIIATFAEPINFNYVEIHQNGARIWDYQILYYNGTWNIFDEGRRLGNGVNNYPCDEVRRGVSQIKFVIGYSSANPTGINDGSGVQGTLSRLKVFYKL